MTGWIIDWKQITAGPEPELLPNGLCGWLAILLAPVWFLSVPG
jgi:hypothetical protein